MYLHVYLKLLKHILKGFLYYIDHVHLYLYVGQPCTYNKVSVLPDYLIKDVCELFKTGFKMLIAKLEMCPKGTDPFPPQLQLT